MDIVLGWNLYCKIIGSILSKTDQMIVESQYVSDRLKCLIDFMIEPKKITENISYYINF